MEGFFQFLKGGLNFIRRARKPEGLRRFGATSWGIKDRIMPMGENLKVRELGLFNLKGRWFPKVVRRGI